MIQRIVAVYFSPTRTTQTVTTALAQQLAETLGCPYEEIDITTPAQRRAVLQFSETDLVVFGAPVYIGRMPNLISPYFKTLCGHGAWAVPVAVYGNRAYDDGLIELRDILEEDGFRLIAAGAFVGEHTFSRILGAGRPDHKDLECIREFATGIAQHLSLLANRLVGKLNVPGTPYPYAGFYPATDQQQKRIDIRKALPQTDASKCNRCGLCATLCAMEAIDPNDCSQIIGKCIKCGACLKRCPQGAKYFDDPQYLSHLQLLEEKFSSRRCEPELFYCDIE